MRVPIAPSTDWQHCYKKNYTGTTPKRVRRNQSLRALQRTRTVGLRLTETTAETTAMIKAVITNCAKRRVLVFQRKPENRQAAPYRSIAFLLIARHRSRQASTDQKPRSTTAKIRKRIHRHKAMVLSCVQSKRSTSTRKTRKAYG